MWNEVKQLSLAAYTLGIERQNYSMNIHSSHSPAV